ncbi:MAG: hypothetical protein K6E27_09505 [Eubacterium sp.]|nr:hypothetical protein [Eubacterium sp.]
MSTRNGKKASGGIPFYEKDSSYKACGIMSLGGGALLIAATFFSWVSFYVKITEVDRGSISIFKALIEVIKGGIRIGGIIPAFLLLVYYALVLFLMLLGFKDNIQRQPFFDNKKKRIRFFGLVIAVVLLFLITKVPTIRDTLGRFNELKDSWVSFITSSQENGVPGSDLMKCVLCPGIGFYMYIVGAVLYFISIIFNFILETLNEDDD